MPDLGREAAGGRGLRVVCREGEARVEEASLVEGVGRAHDGDGPLEEGVADEAGGEAVDGLFGEFWGRGEGRVGVFFLRVVEKEVEEVEKEEVEAGSAEFFPSFVRLLFFSRFFSGALFSLSLRLLLPFCSPRRRQNDDSFASWGEKRAARERKRTDREREREREKGKETARQRRSSVGFFFFFSFFLSSPSSPLSCLFSSSDAWSIFDLSASRCEGDEVAREGRRSSGGTNS